jgi:GrpB-like predicted nucleotidyltransferase (UPF0157 family)
MQSASASEALGLRRGVVEVVPYDARWLTIFEETAAELRSTLGDSILAIHHVGSTSVPNLCAKPVLDVLVSVPDFDAALQLVPRIEGLPHNTRISRSSSLTGSRETEILTSMARRTLSWAFCARSVSLRRVRPATRVWS